MNSTFHHRHKASTFTRWADATSGPSGPLQRCPEGFRISV
ncbi:hypothetical protein U0027_25315 (plasmid) [Agrobacterium tumefaciens]|nr:hypothetical protein [Agrobacterium tumefaciens]WQE43640.1 hypothetical protein U0027_25315 [Agrobacterium tumefaciens]